MVRFKYSRPYRQCPVTYILSETIACDKNSRDMCDQESRPLVESQLIKIAEQSCDLKHFSNLYHEKFI